MIKPILVRLTAMCRGLSIPCETVVFSALPVPESYAVLTPIADVYDLPADNQPGAEIEHARLSLFTKGNYLVLRDLVCHALTRENITVTGRRYVGFEEDTGFHHYAIDCATHHLVQNNT